MKPNTTLKLLTLASTLAACCLPAHAATTNVPVSTGIGYELGITLGETDSASISGGVGAWSWQDPGIGGSDANPVGWGHASQWIAITLSQDAILQLDLGRNATVDNTDTITAGDFLPTTSYFPSFTIWRNHDTDPGPASFADSPNLVGTWHEYANNGPVAWAEDLDYLDRLKNNGSQESVSANWALAAGNYTVVIGGFSPSATGAPKQGFGATFSTSPIPEPGSLAFLTLTGIAALRRRR